MNFYFYFIQYFLFYYIYYIFNQRKMYLILYILIIMNQYFDMTLEIYIAIVFFINILNAHYKSINFFFYIFIFDTYP